ncbi:winged helix DNA-binding domain-containing protein [Leucobacter chromiireducens]|uniref:winged helix DNA-binding domain-containing protein n=1 Tax=Leucobacter chromiireducens TaxID=283877 RepID=UPI000F6322AA|nr:winged helix DNA-binding domain-containing protein [Leucobacter chromiireducens]
MTEILSQDDLLRLRMRALGLGAEGQDAAPGSGSRSGVESGAGANSRSGSDRIAATARRMLAVQGQDWRSSRWALGVRTPGTTVADVHEAFERGHLVRSWPMRGTIHVVAAEDIGWLQRATQHRVLAGAPKRRAFLGLSDATLERLVELSLAALAGGRALSRDALAETWEAAGVEVQSGWRYHVIWWLCQTGLTTFGPLRGGQEPLLVRTDEWITTARSLAGDDALAELTARYISARGPVAAKDLAWWTGLTVREARHALRLAEAQGTAQPVRLGAADGPELWLAPEQLGAPLPAAGVAAAAEPRPWLLLPAFDEHLLGYTERDAQLDPAHFAQIVPGRNGMFLATVTEHGRTRATWRRSTRAAGGLEVTPLPGETVDAAALAPRLAEWCDFHGVEQLPLTVLGAHGTSTPTPHTRA